MGRALARVVAFGLAIGVFFAVRSLMSYGASGLNPLTEQKFVSDLDGLMADSSYQPNTAEGERFKPYVVKFKEETRLLEKSFDKIDEDVLLSVPRLGAVAGRTTSRNEVNALSESVERFATASKAYADGAEGVVSPQIGREVRKLVDEQVALYRRMVNTLHAFVDLAESRNFIASGEVFSNMDDAAYKQWQSLVDELEKVASELSAIDARLGR